MKHLFLISWVAAFMALTATGEERGANLVILDSVSVENLSIETVPVSRESFEETLFALGRIEVKPSNRAVVSSRISGRIVELYVNESQWVTQGQPVAKIENRLPGYPRKTIELLAPIDGIVTKGHASLGEPVEPEMSLFEIIDMRVAHAAAQVPEDQIGLIKEGSRARIFIAAVPGNVFEGELEYFGTSADVESGTLEVVFHIENGDHRVRPGMRAEFSIVLERFSDVIAVPKESIQGDGGGSFVFVKDFDLPNAFIKVPVVVGLKNDRHVEIKKGLFPGDDVVTRGAYPLAFAGGGGVSLKEALDAAHGHEHNEDGTEMTAEQKRQKSKAGAGGANSVSTSGLTVFLGLLSAFLLVLLVFSARVQGHRQNLEGTHHAK